MKNSKTKIAISLVLIFSFIFSFTSCKSDGTGAEIVFDLDAEPASIDPQIASDPSSLIVLNNVFEGLLRTDENGKLSNGCAQSYEISEDKLTYTFTLKDNLSWSDDKELTANDFVFAFKRIFDPATKSPGVKLFSNIQNSSAVLSGEMGPDKLGVLSNGNKVIFKLNKPDPSFLKLLTSPSAMPCREDFFYDAKGKYGLERKSLIFNGPFVMTNWVHGELIFLVPNNNYDTKKVFPKSVRLNITPNSQDRLNNFKQKDTNALKIEYEDFVKLDSEKIQTTSFSDTVWVLGFNTKNPTMANATLRDFLTLSFDKNSYKDRLNEYFKLANSIIPDIISIGNEGKKYSELTENPFKYDYNPEKARELYNQYLNETGQKKFPKITILVPNVGEHRFVISHIQQFWQKELGLFINLELLEYNDLLSRVEKGDYQMAVFPIKAEYDNCSSVLSSFTSGNPKNYIGFSNSEYDSLVSKMTTETDTNAQLDMFKKAERLLANSKSVVPLYYQEALYANWNKVAGITFSPFGHRIDFSSAYIP